MALQGALWLAKRLSLNLNFSFLNQISLVLISSIYEIILTRLGGPRSGPNTSWKISRIQSGIEPGTSWMAVRRANHYTKQAVIASIHYIHIIYYIYYFLSRDSACSVNNLGIVIRVFCSRADRSLQAQKPRLQFCRRQVFHRKLRKQACSFNRDSIGAVASRCFPHTTLSLAA